MKPNPSTNELGDADTHESYAMIEISRYTCTPPQNFFGSSVKHHSGISLRIHKAIKRRSLAEDRYFAHGTIVEVDMSAAQFADLVCSPNIGDGVPCTLRFVHVPEGVPQGKLLEKCPEENVRQRIQEDFKAKMTAITEDSSKLVEQTKAILAKPSILKDDRKTIADAINTLVCQIRHNMPFINQQFNEAMDSTLTGAKADLEMFVSQLARSLGAEKLAQQVKDNAQGLLEAPPAPQRSTERLTISIDRQHKSWAVFTSDMKIFKEDFEPFTDEAAALAAARAWVAERSSVEPEIVYPKITRMSASA